MATKSEAEPTLAERLRAINLHYTAEHLDDVIAHATKRRWAAAQLLEYVCEHETDERAQRTLQRRLTSSRLGRYKPLADFDWAWPTKIERQKIETALTLDFLTDSGNLVFVAAQGLGKTMLARNIGHRAVLEGHAVRFVTASDMLLDLSGQDTSRGLDRRLKYWSNIKLLIIDEIGYLSYDNRAADLLFQVISRRYERRSVILTTNLPFKDWPTIFPNAACTTALIDRLVHHAVIIPITGDSYRLREAGDKRTKRGSKTS